jgi:hypothetical protein
MYNTVMQLSNCYLERKCKMAEVIDTEGRKVRDLGNGFRVLFGDSEDGQSVVWCLQLGFEDVDIDESDSVADMMSAVAEIIKDYR